VPITLRGPASTSSMAAPTIASVMVSAGTARTLSAARRAIAEGGVYLNNHRVTSEDQVVTPDDLFHDRYALVRRGKRAPAVFEWGTPSEAGIASTDAADRTESGDRPER
jgi:tyrosyl-tRNA synthetase